jgi:type I restriction enzyme S subunit
MDELPTGWANATIKELAGPNGLVSDGDWIESKDQDPDGTIRLIQLQDVGDGSFINKSKRRMNYEAAERLKCTYLRANDLLIARMPDPIGRACIFPDIEEEAVTVVDILLWRSDPGFSAALPGWMMHAINSPTTRNKILEQAGGTTRQRIAGGKLKEIAIPVPPLGEQTRIIDKVDRLIARGTVATAELQKIPQLIAKYKSTIIELAFSGKLTADYRRSPKGNDDGIPSGWVVRPLGEISDIQGGVQVGKKRSNPIEMVEVPYLRVANVQRGHLNLADVRTMLVTEAEKERLLLKNGDILMNEGGDLDKLGRGWIWDNQITECIHQNHVFRIRLKSNIVPPKFISYFANELGQKYFINQGTQTTNLASISKRKVAALPIPIPPTDEALEIVRRIDTAFTWLERIQLEQEQALKLLARLNGAILDKAIAGKLTSQSSADGHALTVIKRLHDTPKLKPEVRNTLLKSDRMNRSPKEAILNDSASWPAKGLPFDEIARRVPLPYDDIRDALFSLLAGEKAYLRQVFDKEANCMHLQRNPQ